MVRGETFNLQTFESAAFRHFINVFTNKQSGVTLGCEVTQDAQNINVAEGYFFIQGGLLRETTGTANTIPTDAGYYKLVYEIDLSKTNTKDNFNQGSYKFIKALGDYPELTQQDLDSDGTIYQFPFAQFRITEQGIQDFKDIRTIVDYGIYEKKKSIISGNPTNLTLVKNGNTKMILNPETVKVVGEKLEFNQAKNTFVAKEKCRVSVNANIYIVSLSADAYILANVNKNETAQYVSAIIGNDRGFSVGSIPETPAIELEKGEYIYFNLWTSNTVSSPVLDPRSYIKIVAE